MRVLSILLLCSTALCAQCTKWIYNPFTGRLDCAPAAEVTSVFGRAGAVGPVDNDYAGTANAYTAGKKQTFQASATTAGANVACAALPSSPAAGDVACDAGDGNKIKQYNGAAWVDLTVQGGSGGDVYGGSALTTPGRMVNVATPATVTEDAGLRSVDGVFSVDHKLQTTPSASQSITAVGDTISCNATVVQVTPTGSAWTLTSTPTIADGVAGQHCTIFNLSTSYSLTIQDEAVLTNSNLRMGGVNRTIYSRGSLSLVFDGTDWRLTADQALAELPSQVGNAGKRLFTDGSTPTWRDENGCASSGGTDSYACSTPIAFTALTSGAAYIFKADVANTGACSINFNGIGGCTIKKVAGGVTTDLSDNDIRANQWVVVVYDGTNCQMVSQLGNAGGGGLTTSILSFPGGNCQMGAASTGFALPSSNYPTAYCLTTGSTVKGLLAFSDAATDESVQWDIILPSDWNATPGILLDVRWTQSGADTGNARWGIYGVCTADGEAINNPTFSSVLAFADAAKGVAWQNNDTAQQTLTTGDVIAGCAAGETLHLKFARTSSHADDTFNGTVAYLDKIRLTIARTP